MPTSGHEPGELGDAQERQAVQARRTGRLGVAGPAAATFGEQHDRKAQLGRQLEQAVLLAMVQRSLRAGEHRVVVGRDDAT